MFQPPECQLVHRRECRFAKAARPPRGSIRCDSQSRLPDIHTRGMNTDCCGCVPRERVTRTTAPLIPVIRQSGGSAVSKRTFVRRRLTGRDSELPHRIVLQRRGRTHLQGFELRKSPCIHPSGVT